jgi:Na+:H+ antiporter, NhaA family
MSQHPTPSVPPGAWAPLLHLSRAARKPLEQFLRIEASSGIVLLGAALFALVMANSPWAENYLAFWHTPVGLTLGTFHFEKSIEWLVNDALMVIFFFVVGLEIKREMIAGELSEIRRATLPVVAALGGMVVPAFFYVAVANQNETRSGWGIPMATDIAFAVGILALLGKRVPPALRVLLLALAVIDDLGAIVVIAVFYSSGIAWFGFAIAGLGLLGIVAMQRFGVRSKILYIAPAVVAWAGIAASGVHPTIAGVIIGLMTPSVAWLGADGFAKSVGQQLNELGHASGTNAHELSEILGQIDLARREAISPLESLIEHLHPWVAYAIMPIFALANAGVSLSGIENSRSSSLVMAGIALGLVFGKPLGIFLACFLAVKSKLSILPAGITFKHLAVLGAVAGVGFTMSLFVSQLAFGSGALLSAAKVAILAASFAASIFGLSLGMLFLPSQLHASAAPTADQAEQSTEM